VQSKSSRHAHIEQVQTIPYGTAKTTNLATGVAASGYHIHQTIRYVMGINANYTTNLILL
jgi:hypothetical protein